MSRPNKLEYYITVGRKGLPGANSSLLGPFVSYKDKHVSLLGSFVSYKGKHSSLCAHLQVTSANTLA
jgi:hypothetical protein